MLIGLLAGVFWALDTVIIGTVIQVGNEKLREVLLNPIIAGGIHDIFAAVWIFMYLKCKNKLSSVYEKIKTKTRLHITVTTEILKTLCIRARSAETSITITTV